MKDKQLGCEYIAKLFAQYGITHVFNMEAMLRMTVREMEKEGIQIVMAHSENGAGYMADGYARASGRIGVCMAQSIGAANLAGGIHDAYLASSPVLALTGKKTPLHQYRDAYQESDHRLFYESITKFNGEAVQPEQLPFLLRQAIRCATTGRSRPVHLDMPNHMGRLMEAAEITEPIYSDPIYGSYPPVRQKAPEDAIAKAAAALHAALRPVLVGGRGAAVSHAGQELLELAEKNDIPLVTSPDGKTLVDEGHPLWGGIAGGYGMVCANKTIQQADLVIFVGTAAGDQTTCDWRAPLPGTTVIQIDIEPSELGKNYPNTIGLAGDARTILKQLTAAVKKETRINWREQVKDYLKETLEIQQMRIDRMGSMLNPEQLCDSLSSALPDDAVLFSDTGFSAVWTATFLRMKASQSYYRAAGSLGWAFPAALGAKCANPDRPVFAFIGDGGMYYHLSEMETAVRNGIRTITIVNNNQVLAQCSGDITHVYYDDKNTAAKRFSFAPISFCEIAKAFGAEGILVTKKEEIQPAIQRALQCRKPVLIEVMTDKESIVPAAFTP